MRLTYKTQCAWEALKRLSESQKPLCLEDLWDKAGPREACRDVVESLSRTGWVKKTGTLYSLVKRDLSLEEVRRLVEQHFNPDHPFSTTTAVVREALERINIGERAMTDTDWNHPSSEATLARLKKVVAVARKNPDAKTRFSESLRKEIVQLANMEGTEFIAGELGFHAPQLYTWRRALQTPAKEVVKEAKKPQWEECLEKHLAEAEEVEQDEEQLPVLMDPRHTLQPGPIADGLKEKEKARKVLCTLTFSNGARVDVYE